MILIQLYNAERSSDNIFLKNAIRFYDWNEAQEGHPNAIDGFLIPTGEDPIKFLESVLDATKEPYKLYPRKHRLIYKGRDLYFKICEEVVFGHFEKCDHENVILFCTKCKMWLRKHELFQNVTRHEEMVKTLTVNNCLQGVR